MKIDLIPVERRTDLSKFLADGVRAGRIIQVGLPVDEGFVRC